MKLPTHQPSRMWRWIFIGVQSAVFVTFLLTFILESGFGISVKPQDHSLDVALGFSLMAGYVFLLIASPFFFKSLGKLAVIGWIVALGILVISVAK